MTAGRPRTPNELNRKRGNPGKKSFAPLALVASLSQLRIPVPEHLSAAGAAFFEHIVSEAPWISTTDKTLLIQCAEKIDRRSELIARLGDNFVLFTDKAYAYQNPLVSILQALESDITKSLSILGLSPSDRTRIGVGEVKRQSKMEELRKSKANG